jgi:carboxypeptidase C (cathepsin A)
VATDIEAIFAELPGNDRPYAAFLPAYAAVGWYHHLVPGQPAALEPFLAEVETYALGPYAAALAKGTDLSSAEKQQVAEKLHEYAGLPAAYWIKANLRVSGGQFEQALQADENLTTGRLDTRFSGPAIDALSESADYDPQSAAISSAYVSMFNQYVRQTLKYGDGQTYLNSALFNGHHWDWKMPHRMIANVSQPLAEALSMNPRLKVLVMGGYYDLATPYFAAEYEDKHLPISSNLAKNIEYQWFESGHMVYVREECLKQLHDSVAAFIQNTAAAK